MAKRTKTRKVDLTQPFAVWVGDNNPKAPIILDDLHLRYHLVGYSEFIARKDREKGYDPLNYYKRVCENFSQARAYLVSKGIVEPITHIEFDQLTDEYPRTFKAKQFLSN